MTLLSMTNLIRWDDDVTNYKYKFENHLEKRTL